MVIFSLNVMEGKNSDIRVETNHEMLVEEDEFRAGSIHGIEVRDFWINVLQCSPWVVDVLKFGYRLPFKTTPQSYEEMNNASVLEKPLVVERILLDLEKTGVIEFVDFKPHCVNPLGLVTTHTELGEKHRLVLDASRCLNLHIDTPAVKLAHLEKALLLTCQDDYQVIFDLRSAYHHVRIANEHIPFLGAAAMIQGKRKFLVFKHLPFGISSAVHAMTKIWKPITAYLHKMGIPFSIYIDDGRLLASSKEQAEQFRGQVYECVKKAGWQIARDKSDGPGMASQCKQYLGFNIDSHKMTVSYPTTKLDKFCDEIVKSLQSNEVHVKNLAKLLGKMISLSPSHGSCVRICTRSGYAMLEEHVASRGWKGVIPWTLPARREMFYFAQVARHFNGAPIITTLTDIRVDVVLPNPISSQETIQASIYDTVIVSDASKIKAAVKWLQGHTKNWISVFEFSPEEFQCSSGERELLAVHKFLQDPLRKKELNRTNIIWGTDSTNLVSFLEKGSRQTRIQKLIFDVLRFCAENNCVITPIHLYREDERIKEVDYLSKLKDTDNWSIDVTTFDRLDNKFHFTVDLFADVNNARTPQFASKFYHEKALGVDAFSMDWKGILWVCPPTALLVRVIKRIRSCQCEGVLIVPNWPASDFYCKIFLSDKLLQPFELVEEFTPFVYQNEGASQTPLKGITKFTFFALYFKTY